MPLAIALPTRLRPLLTALLIVLATSFACGQEQFKIGVVLPGRESVASADWNEMLAARAWGLARAGDVSGIEVQLVFRDGGTSPGNTARHLRELALDEGVHVIVCCVTRASAATASAFSQLLPILSLARPRPGEPESEWPLVLEPSLLEQARALTRHAADYQGGIGLMTLDNDFGGAVITSVRAGALEAGLPLARIETYPPGARVLTPEALLVAASQPKSVIVWGLPADTAVALDGLRARGYEGPIYLPWDVATHMSPGRLGSWQRIRVAVPPAATESGLPAWHPNATALAAFRSTLQRAYGVYEVTPQGAAAFDALEMIQEAAALATVYGVRVGSLAQFRLALRDALVAGGTFRGAAGSYDFDGSTPEMALSVGLVIARPSAGRFTLLEQ